MTILSELYWNGIATLPDKFEHCREVEDYLKTLPIHDGHVPNRGDGAVGGWDDMLDRPVVCPPLVGGTLSAPHFLEFALRFTDIAEQYLGGFPYLYSVHSFWTRPSNVPENGDIQVWHRDRDAERFVVLFVYGSDVVDLVDGPHRLQIESRPAKTIYGHQGTCFLADTRNLHRGDRPLRGQRLIHWARWSTSERPQSYGWDGMTRISAERVPIERPSERLRESTKLLVDWGN